MMEASRVLFPTPFRPSTISISPGGMTRDMSDMTCVSPHPAQSASHERVGLEGSVMATLPEIDLTHLRVLGNFIRRAFGENASLHENADPIREAEHEPHVVFDDEHAQ